MALPDNSGSEQIAMCVCGAPLVSTFAFQGYEFYCLECGRQYEWLEPRAQPATPELEARHDALRAEWREHAARKLLIDGGYHRDCERCNRGEPHIAHATAEEIAADREARAWLTDRRTETSRV